VSRERTIGGGRYALYAPIAAGGMATVHFGRLVASAGFARMVAVKRLRGELVESPEFVTILVDEARLASRIRHPNVVSTLDMVADEDELFLVMEYVAGESLSRLLGCAYQAGEGVALPIASGILCGVLHGLHAAHEAVDELGEPLGIVHRDVSPENILVGVDGLSRLLDFGIAKGKGRLQTTRAGQLKGKVSYMAPEQILGEEPDRRSDVYAAGVVAWEVLTGKRLFPGGESAGESFAPIPRILEADVVPPSQACPGLSPAIDGIVMRALNRRREARYDSARDFAVALEEATAVATPRQIGEWTSRVAAEALERRAEQVRALERASRSEGAPVLADALLRRRPRRTPESLDPSLLAGEATQAGDDGDGADAPAADDLGSTIRLAEPLAPARDAAEERVELPFASSRWVWIVVALLATAATLALILRS
jgi:serine/threonine-protein kinase